MIESPPSPTTPATTHPPTPPWEGGGKGRGEEEQGEEWGVVVKTDACRRLLRVTGGRLPEGFGGVLPRKIEMAKNASKYGRRNEIENSNNSLVFTNKFPFVCAKSFATSPNSPLSVLAWWKFNIAA